MGHYAKVKQGKVVQVIVAEASFFNNFVDDSPGKWIQTSYNTRGGIHYQPNSNTPSPVKVTMIINDYTSSFVDEDAMNTHTASLKDTYISHSADYSASLLDPERSGSVTQPIEPTFGSTGTVDTSKTLALRGNYAGIGYEYDSTLDAFFAPQPYTSWTKNTSSFSYDPPIAFPSGDATGSYTGSYVWSESTYNADSGDPKTEGWITSSLPF